MLKQEIADMKTKTLIVSYLPAGERSTTKQLLETFIEESKQHTDIEILDLMTEPPAFYLPESLSAYGMRNYGGMELSEELKKSIAPMDKLVEQLKSADAVVLAYPMHNFGMPGIVKTWFDAVLQHGVTFKYGANGPEGLMSGKKALTLYASGGAYTQGQVTAEYPNWDSLTMQSRILLGFMGYSEVEVIGAQGVLNPAPGVKESVIEAANEKVRKVVKKWYVKEAVAA